MRSSDARNRPHIIPKQHDAQGVLLLSEARRGDRVIGLPRRAVARAAMASRAACGRRCSPRRRACPPVRQRNSCQRPGKAVWRLPCSHSFFCEYGWARGDGWTAGRGIAVNRVRVAVTDQRVMIARNRLRDLRRALMISTFSGANGREAGVNERSQAPSVGTCTACSSASGMSICAERRCIMRSGAHDPRLGQSPPRQAASALRPAQTHRRSWQSCDRRCVHVDGDVVVVSARCGNVSARWCKRLGSYCQHDVRSSESCRRLR
jgi:hypothetical protein